MNRTLGFEKTIQAGQFQPVKVSSFVNDIPDTVWSQDGFVEELGNLLIVQAHKILQNEYILSAEMRNSEGDKKQLLDKVEKEILEVLDLKNLVLTLNVEITTK